MMAMIWNTIVSLFPAFLQACGDQTALLYFLHSPDERLFKNNIRIALFLLSIPIATLFQRGGGLDFSVYTMLALQSIFYVAFIFLWTRQNVLNSLYLSMVYLLTSDCIRIFCSFLSQKLYGDDVFMRGSLPHLLLVNLVQTAVLMAVVWGVRYFVQRAERIAIRFTQLPLLFVSLIPYLFIRGIIIWLPLRNEDLSVEIPVMLLVTLAVGLILMVGNVNMISSQRHAYELRQMEQVMASQHAQFLSSQENADLINRKYHDLKNTLLYIRECTDQDEIRRHLDRMWEQIRPYEVSVKTGNQTMDILLNQKLALCQENEITCVPYIDGKLLDFISPLDLCTLFGNAMDNAIEATAQIPESEKRQIQIKTARKNQMVILRITNSFAVVPKEQDGILISSKPDTLSHGYGIRSMQQTAASYGGQIHYHMADGIFTLNIMLPLPANCA